MQAALNIITEEDIKLLEKESNENILFKSKKIKFIYNRLSLGYGDLYLTKNKLIWIKYKEDKKIEDFKDLSNDSTYLNYYEKNKEFFLHLLNDVDNICIDSSKIALHALSSYKQLCNDCCVYIQLNDGIFNKFNKDNNKEISEHIENENVYENYEIMNIENIIPEIILIGKDSKDNDNIFHYMNNFDSCIDEDNYENEEFNYLNENEDNYKEYEECYEENDKNHIKKKRKEENKN